jgi:hypothetical protein
LATDADEPANADDPANGGGVRLGRRSGVGLLTGFFVSSEDTQIP